MNQDALSEASRAKFRELVQKLMAKGNMDGPTAEMAARHLVKPSPEAMKQRMMEKM